MLAMQVRLGHVITDEKEDRLEESLHSGRGHALAFFVFLGDAGENPDHQKGDNQDVKARLSKRKVDE